MAIVDDVFTVTSMDAAVRSCPRPHLVTCHNGSASPLRLDQVLHFLSKCLFGKAPPLFPDLSIIHCPLWVRDPATSQSISCHIDHELSNLPRISIVSLAKVPPATAIDSFDQYNSRPWTLCRPFWKDHWATPIHHPARTRKRSDLRR